MTYAIAAAGTGGHVYPGLAVGDALVASGVPRSDVLFIGGSRLGLSVYPEAGFDFLELELRGLKRSLSPANLTLPSVVWRAARRTRREFAERGVRVVLGLGGYVTVPVGWAARTDGIPVFVAEQNAEPGLANRIVSRWAVEAFTSFPNTPRLKRARHVGNPLRRDLAEFSRASLRHEALARYELQPGKTVVGVVGGSLGAGALNEAVVLMAEAWDGPDIQIVHLAGVQHADVVSERAGSGSMPWKVLAFEESMAHFYAACDLVVSRAGGMVAEILATGTPSILVPGTFGSSGHQVANARELAAANAAWVLPEAELARLGDEVARLALDAAERRAMSAAALEAARPDAAAEIARALRAHHVD